VSWETIARRCYEAAVEVASRLPLSARYLLTRARSFEKAEKLTLAICMYRAAVRADTTSADAWLGLANALSRQARTTHDLQAFTAAIAAFEGVLAIKADWAPALCGLGILASYAGYSKHAVDLYERAAKIKPLSTFCALEQAQCLEKLSRMREASEVLRAALHQSDGCEEIRLALARVLSRMGDNEGADSMLNELSGTRLASSPAMFNETVAAAARAGNLWRAKQLLEDQCGFRISVDPQPSNSQVFEQDVVTVVWGHAFLEDFLRVTLPNLLANGNLRDLKRARYRLYTLETDLWRLVKHPTFGALQAALPVTVITFAERWFSQIQEKYWVSNCCHQHAVIGANIRGTGLIFINPDSVYSQGSFAAMEAYAAKGYRAILISGPRMTKETALKDLLKYLQLSEEIRHPTISIPPRALVAILLEHLHPLMVDGFTDSGVVSDHWSSIYERVPGEGLIARQLHLHPLMVKPENARALPEGTLDTTFVSEACPDPGTHVIIRDSDEIMGVSWSDAHDNAGIKRYRATDIGRKAAMIAHLGRRQINSFNTSLLAIPINLHLRPIGPTWTLHDERLRNVEQRIAAAISSEFAARAEDY